MIRFQETISKHLFIYLFIFILFFIFCVCESRGLRIEIRNRTIRQFGGKRVYLYT